MIIGVDEVGRGCGSGPIMACAFIFLQENVEVFVADSKKLSANRRSSIYKKLLELRKTGAVNWALTSISATKIDEVGIQRSNEDALRAASLRLISQLKQPPYKIVVDGNLKLKPILVGTETVPFTSIPKADSAYREVSAASIVAKVVRDEYMILLHKKYPGYNWQQNKGYLTKDHCDAIKASGLTPHHRKTFCKRIS